VPLFAELRGVVYEAWAAAPNGDYVFSERFRNGDVNLRTQLERIIEDNPAAEQRALAAAENAAKALWTALDGIEAARMSRAA